MLKSSVQGNIIVADWGRLDEESNQRSGDANGGVPLNADSIGRKVAGMVINYFWLFLVNQIYTNELSLQYNSMYNLGLLRWCF